MSDIQKNLEMVKSQINKTCDAWDVDQGAVQLIAVSKKQPDDKIDAMIETGHRIYGENRVQDAIARWEKRKEKISDLELHLIGPLQTNKVKDAVKLFDAIHTVDRPKLVRALIKEMKARDKTLSCFIQVNTGEEDQKSGVLPADFDALYQLCQDEGLRIDGLMCIPPEDELPAHHFALLRKIAQKHGLKNLSMGMSGDFQKAIPITINGGRLYIRVGTALFGARDR